MKAPSASDAGSARHSYRQILRSSTLVGSAALLQMAIGLVRTKAFAVWLGPSGLGLMSVLSTVLDLARSLAGLGLNQSGVRQIAAASATGQAARIARTAVALRWTAAVLGFGGGLALAVASPWVSQLTFGTAARAPEVAWLGAALALRLLADGHGALVHGLRRIGDMTRADLLAAALGSAVAIGLVRTWQEAGVAPALVAIAGLSALTSWWMARRAAVTLHALDAGPAAAFGALGQEARALLVGGLALMGSGLLTLGAAWAVRLVLVRHAGLAEAGLFQSAWTLGGLLVGVVVQAMGADFYPRLVGVAQNDAAANRLVNEQMLVNLLLGGVGVLLTMTVAPVVLPLLYSRAFEGAQETLRWIGLGMALRVVTWPLGTLLVAKGVQARLLAADGVWAVAWIGLAWVLVAQVGPVGAGIAFFAAYAVQAALLAPMVRGLSGLRLTAPNRHLAVAMAILIGAVFLGSHLLTARWAMGLGAVATLAAALLALHVLRAVVSPQALPPALRRWLAPTQRPGEHP